ncbi:MAG: hypothetical protein WD875_03015 [Pirellulales bacterium]
MVTTTLVEANVKLGEEVYDAIKRDATLGVRAALWWYDVDASEWRYMVAAEDCARRGPRAAYLRVRNLLKRANLLDRLPLAKVVVVRPDDRTLATIKKMFDFSKTPRPMHFALENITIPGLHIEGAFLYDA